MQTEQILPHWSTAVKDQLEALVNRMIEQGIQFPDAITEFEKRFIQRMLETETSQRQPKLWGFIATPSAGKAKSSGWITSPSGGNDPNGKCFHINFCCNTSLPLMNNPISLPRGRPAQSPPGQPLLQALFRSNKLLREVCPPCPFPPSLKKGVAS
jgi:hypothetical protein